MEIDFDTIDGVAICTVEGRLDADEALSYAKRMLSQAEGRPLKLIWDLRNASFDMDTDDVKNLAASIRKFTGGGGPNSAFVLSQDLEFGLARMFQAYRNLEDPTIAVFREFDSAVDWITGPQTR